VLGERYQIMNPEGGAAGKEEGGKEGGRERKNFV
jgi:hypothetical protein